MCVNQVMQYLMGILFRQGLLMQIVSRTFRIRKSFVSTVAYVLALASKEGK